jgi:DNA-binding SARP family transcriptional activator
VLDFRILGPLEVIADAGAVRLGGPKQRATLAILLLNANRVVSVERLADELYSGATPITAVTQVQRQISELRKLLGADSTIETRAPGYVIRLSAEQLDLNRFERRTEEAGQALRRGAVERAAALLREALAFWRGPPLADFAYEPFAQAAIERIEEIRLTAVDQRIDADLALGRHAELVGEVEQLVSEHPLRERFRAQLMVALYRSGRQAEALEVYRGARETLVEAFGIEPTSALRDLERAILTHDPSLDLSQPPRARVASSRDPSRAVLVVPSCDDQLDTLLRVAERLASLPERELIITRLVRDEGDVEPAAARLNGVRRSLHVTARTAAFTTSDSVGDVVRLATSYDVELVLLDAPSDLAAARLPDELAELLEHSPGDVAVVAGSLANGDGVFVPFAGGEHDWSALEIGACLSVATSAPLRLVGTSADPRRAQRDASRLLADASLAVQRVVGVEAEPVLVEPSEHALVAAVEGATVVVMGISERWRREGIGDSRRALLRGARAATLLVHRGPRPGGLAPREARTRFSWTIEASYLQAVSTAAT